LIDGGDRQKAQTAARIFGKAFISEKISVEPLEVLPIEGWERGLEMMLGPATESTD
jgi:hypothetical protein